MYNKREEDRKRYHKNKVRILAQHKVYYKKNKKRISNYNALYRKNNPQQINDYCKKWYSENKETKLKKSQIYYNQNKQQIISQHLQYKNQRYKIDSQFKMLNNLKSRIFCALRNQNSKKIFSTSKLVGCSIDKLKKHLEAQFQTGMTWANHSYNGWHIDHIKPCVSFDLTKLKEQKACFNYKNLQPLWARNNIQKGGKY